MPPFPIQQSGCRLDAHRAIRLDAHRAIRLDAHRAIRLDAHRAIRLDAHRVLRILLLIVPVAVAGTACRTARAAEPIERPALEVPPPPPRVIIPIPAADAQPRLEPVDQLPVSTDKSPTKPRPNRDKPDPNKPADPKAEAVEASNPPPAPAVPPLRLENPNAGQLSSQVRETLARAQAIIDKIDRNSLTTEPRRQAYDNAKAFAQQAEDEIKKSNFIAAKELADKAERYAKELQGR